MNPAHDALGAVQGLLAVGGGLEKFDVKTAVNSAGHHLRTPGCEFSKI